jgi:hypothetical protein
MTLNDIWKNENHSADCYQVIPVPNRTYFESRTICVCGLQGFDNRSNYRTNNNKNETTQEGNAP